MCQLLKQILVGAEASSGENDGACINNETIAIQVLAYDTRHRPVVQHNGLDGPRVKYKLDPEFLTVLVHGLNRKLACVYSAVSVFCILYGWRRRLCRLQASPFGK